MQYPIICSVRNAENSLNRMFGLDRTPSETSRVQDDTSGSLLEDVSRLMSKDPRMTRRDLLRFFCLGASFLVLSACAPKEQKDQSQPTEKPLVFSGERRETKELLMQWAREANNKPDKIEKYLPKIANLAIAYFSHEMSDMFPDRKSQYEPSRYKDKIEFLSRESFFKEVSECGRTIDPNELGAINIEKDDKIYINKEPPLNNKRVEVYFFTILHELGHFSPPRKEYPQGKQIKVIPEPIHYEKGLLAYAAKEIKGCGTNYRHQIEETVVHHLTTKLAVGLGLYVTGVAYDKWVKIYEEKVITQLFSGDFKKLLSYHQETKPEEFFQSIGRRAFSESIPPQAQQDFGDVYIHKLLLE